VTLSTLEAELQPSVVPNVDVGNEMVPKGSLRDVVVGNEIALAFSHLVPKFHLGT
jgi:hypothetical protein